MPSPQTPHPIPSDYRIPTPLPDERREGLREEAQPRQRPRERSDAFASERHRDRPEDDDEEADAGRTASRSRFGRWLASSKAFSPLAEPVFRMLWLAWLASHLCMWMNDVAAAWLMTTLRPSPVWVAMVQAAATLPVFLLGLPSGALADILDRRLFFLGTQLWLVAVATTIFLLSWFGWMSAELLVLLTFMNGIGLALRWPVFAAIVPEIIARAQLPAAMGLNGIAMNVSRIVGPLLAGAVIAFVGSPYVFALNAVLSICAALAILSWKRPKNVSVLPGERFIGAIRVGLRYVRAAPHYKPLLLRVSIFFFHTTAVLALMPLLATDMRGQDPHAFTALLASLGSGAIVSVLMLQQLRARFDIDELIRHGTLVQAAAVAGIALSPWFALTLLLMAINGMAWLVVANSMSVTAQMSLPDWVRARGMSVFQVALMGSSALGALFWGQIAALTDVRTSILAASLSSVAFVVLSLRVRVSPPPADALIPVARKRPKAVGEVPRRAGPVVVLIEYRIDPARRDAFLEVMEETRRTRFQHGALSWELLRRSDDPAVYTEMMVDESWIDHLRHFDRITAYDLELRHRRLAFHLGPGEPVITRSIAQRLRVKSHEKRREEALAKARLDEQDRQENLARAKAVDADAADGGDAGDGQVAGEGPGGVRVDRA